MKSLRKIVACMAVLSVIVFMGCKNPADSSSGGTSLNDIEKQIAGGSIADGPDIYKFFPNKKGEKSSGGSNNMRSARAAGSVGFSWSADLEGKVTITMDDSSTAPQFKFAVIIGSIGMVVTKTGSDTPLTFTPPAPTRLDAAAILRQYPAWYEADVHISTNKLSGVGKHRFENGEVFFLDGEGQVGNYTTSGSSVIITVNSEPRTIDFSTMLVDCDKLPNIDENGEVVTHNKAGCKMLYFGDNRSGEIVSWHSNEITITPSSN